MHIRINKTFGLIPLLIATVLLSSCQKPASYFREGGVIYNRSYSLQYQAPRLLTKQIDAELQLLNNSLNAYNPSSTVARVNRNVPVEVDDDFIAVFNKAIEMSEHTEGIFDMTCLPLVLLWRDAYEETKSIPPSVVDSVKKYVGYQKVRLEGRKVIKDDPRIELTLTALAKGYTADRLANLMEENGVKNYMLDIGGAVVAKGVDPYGKSWSVTISKPEETDDRTISIEEVIQIHKKGGVATAGDFHNYYIKDGRKYAHTINPITGYPAEQNILSSTIIAENSMTSDGLSTALTAMNVKDASRIGDQLGINYFFIYTDEEGHYRVTYSQGMKKWLKTSSIPDKAAE